ncbi:MAG: hypothetical protein Q7U54_08475 [Bacteroidales bacterium]|nr:hypothetical protein [Bacteroidales bacterium]
MWKIFNSSQFKTADRRRMEAEKKHSSHREKSRRRRKRAEAWRQFQKRFTEFMAHPFTIGKHTPAEREKQHFKKQLAHDRKIKRRKWWAKFRKNPWRAIFPRKKRRLAGGGYYTTYSLSKKERKELARQKRKQFRDNLRAIFTSSELRQKFGFAYLHSTAYFILAFILIYIIYQVITILLASSYSIPIVWYYYQLKFPLYTYSPLYTRMAMVVIFASGPILSLMLAFVFLRMYFSKNYIARRFKLFFLWGFIGGVNMFFGAYISGFITRTEFIYTSEWLFMSHVFAVEEIVFAIIATVSLIIIGRIITPLFLLSSGSVTLIKPEYRLHFILSVVILPWLTGIGILFLITLPNYYIPLIIKTITPGFLLIPSIFLYNSQKFENIHRSGVIQHNYFRWSILIVAIAILFFYRLILSFGFRVS